MRYNIAMPNNMSVLPIIYQDDDIVLINKPIGIATHQAASFDGDDVYQMLIRQGIKIQTEGDEYRQGIVSRLDVGTSGILVVAKNQNSFISLKKQFANHEVSKTYLALCEGTFNVMHGQINAPIGRHPNPKKRALFSVVDDGKEAITNFDVINSSQIQIGKRANQKTTVSLLKVNLLTGRTHQIRVHMSAYNHPLVGDINYGAKDELAKKLLVTRPLLHSLSLEFTHPTLIRKMKFKADLPTDFTDTLSRLSIDLTL